MYWLGDVPTKYEAAYFVSSVIPWNERLNSVCCHVRLFHLHSRKRHHYIENTYIVLPINTYIAYITVLHTKEGPTNVQKNIRGTDYEVFCFDMISIDV